MTNEEKTPVEAASERGSAVLNDRLGGPPPFAGETDIEIVGDSTYRSRYSFRVF